MNAKAKYTRGSAQLPDHMYHKNIKCSYYDLANIRAEIEISLSDGENEDELKSAMEKLTEILDEYCDKSMDD